MQSKVPAPNHPVFRVPTHQYERFLPKYWLLLYTYLLHLTWAVGKKSVLGDLMKWFMQFGPKLLSVSCLKWTRDETCWIPVLATKKKVPTGYGKRMRQIGRQTTDIPHVKSFLNSYEYRRSREKAQDTWHETGSCGSYVFQFLLPKQDLSHKAFVLLSL